MSEIEKLKAELEKKEFIIDTLIEIAKKAASLQVHKERMIGALKRVPIKTHTPKCGTYNSNTCTCYIYSVRVALDKAGIAT